MTSVPLAPRQAPPPTRLRSLVFTLGPVRHRWRSGVRTAAAFAIPAGMLVAAGHSRFAMFAAFGAFAVMYGDGRPVRTRTGSVAAAGIGLLACTGTGALLGKVMGGRPGDGVVTVVVLTVVAMAAVYGINATRPGPPGALFFMMTCGGGMAAAQAGVAPATIVGCAALGVAGAVLVTLISAGIDYARGDRMTGPRVPAVWRRLRRSWSARSHAVTTMLRVGIACAVAGGIAVSLHWLHPYWAMLTALVVLAQGPHRTGGRARAIHRFAGTVAGLVFFAGLYQLSPSGYWLVALVAALMFAIELFVGSNYAIAVFFITPTALFAGGAGAARSAGPVVRDRFLETMIGVIVAVIVLSVVVPRAHRRTLDSEQRRMQATAGELLAALHEPMDARGRLLCDKLRFDLKGCENAGIDCAHDDARWVRSRWAAHAQLLHDGHTLLTAAEAVPMGVTAIAPEREEAHLPSGSSTSYIPRGIFGADDGGSQ